jgi:hypothetical protein
MSYDDFAARIAERGATEVKRDRDSKTTSFVYKDRAWTCTDKARISMTLELADGYEMDYCLSQYCTARQSDGSST